MKNKEKIEKALKEGKRVSLYYRNNYVGLVAPLLLEHYVNITNYAICNESFVINFDTVRVVNNNELVTIEQALLKAQEQEKLKKY